MPIVKIDLKRGQSTEFLTSMMDLLHESMMETLKLPANDKNIRVTEHSPELFMAKPPYDYFVEIMMFSGRTVETKRLLYKSIVTKLEQRLHINPQSVFIVLNEQPQENWGIRGGIAACDVELGFKVNI